jgi:sterol desaturase/sphingolipid hydroxylase (fatty acid hydroxylase superfamily)
VTRIMMKNVKEFMLQRLILFLICIVFLNAVAACLMPWSFSSLVFLAAGIALFGVSEYVVHRYLLHQFPKLMPKAYQGHVEHHEYPTETEFLFGPVRYDVITYSSLYLVLWLLTGNVRTMFAVALGASLCQLYYQWKHYVSHRPIIPWTPWGKWLKKKHLLHHYLDDSSWYGVSHPWMDFLLGTGKTNGKKTATDIRNKTHSGLG